MKVSASVLTILTAFAAVHAAVIAPKAAVEPKADLEPIADLEPASDMKPATGIEARCLTYGQRCKGNGSLGVCCGYCSAKGNKAGTCRL
ncbi:hypothetical protein ISF_04864 [Cordyceps fumosorosea ARSEF 2679]|uniref:Gurmarin/antimicrobial peptide n=1 Tax=Cordyceps fumosorosea (strain ARSEF 2679) TaxID=1081104 RepID=A0A167VUC6_CORFA|nr:hypothetical protein ISF_04864 [Cordyceps fumosorosea ARSEF 2679]OAA62988.1 hypothetical protein ISF_04864 [Cordyceps fumosorosea ARSEF 2679]